MIVEITLANDEVKKYEISDNARVPALELVRLLQKDGIKTEELKAIKYF